MTLKTYEVVVGDVNDRYVPDNDDVPTVVFQGPEEAAWAQYVDTVRVARTGRYRWVKLRCGGRDGEIVASWPETDSA